MSPLLLTIHFHLSTFHLSLFVQTGFQLKGKWRIRRSADMCSSSWHSFCFGLSFVLSHTRALAHSLCVCFVFPLLVILISYAHAKHTHTQHSTEHHTKPLTDCADTKQHTLHIDSISIYPLPNCARSSSWRWWLLLFGVSIHFSCSSHSSTLLLMQFSRKIVKTVTIFRETVSTQLSTVSLRFTPYGAS